MYAQTGDSKENSWTLKMSCHSKDKNNTHLLKSSLRARRPQQEAINMFGLFQLEQAIGNRGPTGSCESDLPTWKTSAHTLNKAWQWGVGGRQSHQGSQQ